MARGKTKPNDIVVKTTTGNDKKEWNNMQKTMKIGNRIFDLQGHTYIMAILNVTPDSFSDGGSYKTVDDALYRVEQVLAEGADIIDIGGESTRPGYDQNGVSAEEEMERVLPVLEALWQRFDVPVSVDTKKASVAKAALQSGADLVNDIWGLLQDRDMAKVIAQAGATCCLMHNKQDTDYHNLVWECMESLQHSAELALAAGVPKENIILDPGIGFGKTREQNLKVMQQLQQFNLLDYPMLLGTSRKSMIGLTLNLPTDQRLEGTLVTTVLAVQAGWNFVRVHDVEANYRAIKMMEAIRDITG